MSNFIYLTNYIARKIRYHRQIRGLSQEMLSEKAGLGLKYINQIENKKQNLNVQTLEKIIKALDLTVEEFFNFNSLEGDLNSKDTLNLKRLTMKLKQLPKQQQATFIRIFENIIDNLD